MRNSSGGGSMLPQQYNSRQADDRPCYSALSQYQRHQAVCTPFDTVCPRAPKRHTHAPLTFWPVPSLLPSMARMNTMWLREDCSFMAVAPTLQQRAMHDTFRWKRCSECERMLVHGGGAHAAAGQACYASNPQQL